MSAPSTRPLDLLPAWLLRLAVLAACTAGPVAQGTEPRFGTHIPAPGLPGLIVLAGAGAPDAAVETFTERAAQGSIVVLRVGPGPDASTGRLERARGETPLSVLAVSDVDSADGARWDLALDQTTGVWLEGRDGETVARLCRDRRVLRSLEGVLERGGAIGASGSVATALGMFLPESGRRGLGLLPGCIIAVEGDRSAAERLRATVDAHPGHVGLALDAGATLAAGGRRATVGGRGNVHIHLTAGADRGPRTERHGPGRILDLIAFSRAAVARSGPRFPEADPSPPVRAPGTLLIGGGGSLSPDVVRRFIAAAGGPTAPIVVIPTALGPGRRNGTSDVRWLRAAGARDVRIVHASSPEAVRDPSVLVPLRRARGIWFSGGRQWRLVDAYHGTLAHGLMHAVLDRGGVIGGSSAGASVLAEYMVRGHPLDNRIMMAEGYERGLGFLPGTAIDQHFSQRHRLTDMAALKRRFPQLLGIGIDEDTTAIVRGSILEVAGTHRVHIYDGDRNAPPTKRTVLSSGQRYDLVRRRRVGR